MSWKVKKDNGYVQCSLCKPLAIYLEPVPRQKIELLMDKYPHQEWLGYLIGKVSDKGNFFIEDLSIPPHKNASSASAEAEPFHIPDNCVGVIHSHHSMGAFHSGTDQAYVDKNFPVSITVANRGRDLDFDAVSYGLTPCGKNTENKSQVKYVQPEPLFNKEAFLKEAEKNIDMGRKIYRGVNSSVQFKLPVKEGEVWTDENGVVLTQKELENIMKDIYKGI